MFGAKESSSHIISVPQGIVKPFKHDRFFHLYKLEVSIFLNFRAEFTFILSQILIDKQSIS